MKFNWRDIKRKHVESEAINSIGYDPEHRILQIEFTSHDIYNYFAVPDYIHEEFMDAASKGTFFRQHILNQYEYELMLHHKKAG